MNMTKATELLMSIKSKLEKAKGLKSELTGRISFQEEKLKEDFECNTVKEAKIKLESIEKDIKKTEDKLEKHIEELNGIFFEHED